MKLFNGTIYQSAMKDRQPPRKIDRAKGVAESKNARRRSESLKPAEPSGPHGRQIFPSVPILALHSRTDEEKEAFLDWLYTLGTLSPVDYAVIFFDCLAAVLPQIDSRDLKSVSSPLGKVILWMTYEANEDDVMREPIPSYHERLYERQLLAAMLMGTCSVENTLQIVDRNDFSEAASQILFEHARRSPRVPSDAAALYRQIPQLRGVMNEAKGISYLNEVFQSYEKLIGCETYASLVHSNAVERRNRWQERRILQKTFSEGKERLRPEILDIMTHRQAFQGLRGHQSNRIANFPWHDFYKDVLIFKDLSLNVPRIRREILRQSTKLANYLEVFDEDWPRAKSELEQLMVSAGVLYPYPGIRLSDPRPIRSDVHKPLMRITVEPPKVSSLSTEQRQLLNSIDPKKIGTILRAMLEDEIEGNETSDSHNFYNYKGLVYATLDRFGEIILDDLLPAWRAKGKFSTADKDLFNAFAIHLREACRVLRCSNEPVDPFETMGDVTAYLAIEVLEGMSANNLENMLLVIQDLWRNSSMGEKQTPPGLGPAFDRKALPRRREAGAGESVAQLVKELQPSISDGQLLRLETAIHDAQKKPPLDKRQFVTDVNRILDLCQFRIIVAKDEPVRLAFRPGGNGQGYIQFTGRRKVPAGSFETTKFRIMPVFDDYSGSRHKITLKK